MLSNQKMAVTAQKKACYQPKNVQIIDQKIPGTNQMQLPKNTTFYRTYNIRGVIKNNRYF